MKLILSRKGFDAGYGGVASPILPDGSLLSLPIPDARGTVTYGDLVWGDVALGPLVEALTRGKLQRQQHAHLDPDLYGGMVARARGWRPLFGQDGAAQSHLANQGVGVGDLFLFFGWFRAVEVVGGAYRYGARAPDQQVIYGWLQVGSIIQGAQLPHLAPPWAANHPHCVGGRGDRNTIYIAAEHLTLAGAGSGLPGAGIVPTYHPRYCLTAPGALRTQWQLPRWFYPHPECPPLTYHRDLARWSLSDDFAYLRSATRGQEFVLDTQYYPEALAWVRGLLVGSETVGR